MNHILVLIKKEFLQLRRDPRLITYIIMMPVVLFILFGLALKLEPESVRMAYVDQEHSFFSDLIRTNIWNEGYFKLYEVEDEATLIEEIRTGKAKAGLFIDKNFSAELIENKQPWVKMYVDGTMPSLATAMDNNSGVITDEKVTNDMYFLEPDAENVIIAPDPFILDVEILFNPDKRETWFFLPGVIGVLIMQIALILTSTAVVREREYNTLEQIIVSPITRTKFIIGKIVPYMMIAFVDFYLILGLGWWLFEIPLPSSQWLLLLLVFLYVTGLIALGVAISTVSQTQQQAIFLSIFILIPSILLSGFIFPLEAMPVYIRPVAYVLPFTYFVEIIRGLLLKANSFQDLFIDYAALLGFMIVFITISIRRLEKTLG
jgi:ABC-2 type transport system permease protein